jgi:PAS domain S-box-containing protein
MSMEKSSDSPSLKQLESTIALLERRVQREREARKSAELILESKSHELYKTNQSLGLVNEKLENQLEQNKQFLQSINDFSSYLVGKKDLTEISSIITKKLISRFDIDDCAIYLVEEGYCRQISSLGSKISVVNPIDIKVGVGIIGAVAQSGKPELVNDTSLDARYIFEANFRQSELTVPIIFDKEVIGIINTEHSQKNFFTKDHLNTIVTIASLISVIFKNSLTEQKNINLESGIEKRTEIISSLIQNLHSGLLLNDEKGSIVLINDVFRNIFKFNIPNNAIIGKNQLESAALVKHLFKDSEGFLKIVNKCSLRNETISRNELELVDGTILDCDFIPIYSKGEFIGQMWQVSDVTTGRTYQKNIEASEEKYRGIIENMELGLLEVDNNHTILKAYNWFCLMTGYSEAELIGQDAREVFLEDKYLEIMDQEDERRSKGEQSIYEVELKKKSGELIWVLISGAPFYNQSGEIIGTIGIHYNIDARKKLEEELKKSKLQTEKAREAEKQFLANMSHEIRNPLNAIIGITNLMYDTKPTKEQLNHLDKLKYSSDILLGLITGVLDTSKIESGTLVLTEKEIDLSEIVTGLIQLASFNTGKKKIKYLNKLESSGEFSALADATILNQIFLNLLHNATKFTEVGEITVQGKILESHADHKNFEFTITDSGIGIPKGKLSSIFNTFVQADDETKLKYGGTGLGLSIVKKLVEKYQGDIRAESVLGVGTSIIFNLKLKPISSHDLKIENPTFEAKAKQRLLVVEDNEINQYYLSGLLKKWNLVHDIANNGYEAIEALEKNVYDLILMDIRMPGMDGYEATIKLRAMKQNKNYMIPVIALTASALVDERDRALQAGMNYHLTKPYTSYELGEALTEFGIIEKVQKNLPSTFQFSTDLDVEYLDDFYENEIDRANLMFEIFDRVIDDEFNKLKQSLSNQEWDKVSTTAHKIKPNFSMVGLIDISIIMEEYEKAKINPEVREELASNFAKLEMRFDVARLVIKSELIRMKRFLEL